LRGRCRERRAQAPEGFFGFRFPFSAAKALSSGGVPSNSLIVPLRLLFDGGNFERDHGITGFRVELREFGSSVGAVLSFADARLNLTPIGHVAAL
jgi:hypothetical protein